jgi:hypothetical protein
VHQKKKKKKKKLRGLPPVFRKPLRPVPNLTICPSSSIASEPEFVAILLNLLKKKKSDDAKGKC